MLTRPIIWMPMRFRNLTCSGGFFLLLAWLNYTDGRYLLPEALLACLIHELGHIICLHSMGIRIACVRLTAVGAELSVEQPMSYRQEGIAALAGPGANFLAALCFCRWPALDSFSGVNLALGCFNLLPASRLDGGRALLATLSLVTDPSRAERVGEGLNVLFLLLLLPVGLFVACVSGNVTVLIIGLWLCLRQKKGKKKRNSTCHTIQKQVK